MRDLFRVYSNFVSGSEEEWEILFSSLGRINLTTENFPFFLTIEADYFHFSFPSFSGS